MNHPKRWLNRWRNTEGRTRSEKRRHGRVIRQREVAAKRAMAS